MASPRRPTDNSCQARPSERGGSGLPIVRHLRPQLGRSQKAKIENLARELKSQDPRLGSTEAFGPSVASGLGPWPSLVFEDHSGISLYNPKDKRLPGSRPNCSTIRGGEGPVLVTSERARTSVKAAVWPAQSVSRRL